MAALHDDLERAAASFGQRTALHEADRSYTWQQVNAVADSVASQLSRHGVIAGNWVP